VVAVVSPRTTHADVVTLLQTIAEGKHITGDLGGKASTKEYTEAILSKLK
jgi:isocitrate/isopropylmalate dehydrogenase